MPLPLLLLSKLEKWEESQQIEAEKHGIQKDEARLRQQRIICQETEEKNYMTKYLKHQKELGV